MAVPERSKDRLRALWESGVRLDWAWIDFALVLDRFAIRALRTHPANDSDVLARDPRYKELCRGWLPRTWEARQRKLAITTKNERIHLLGEIYAEHLWAIGYRTLPSGSDELVRVPRQLFFFDEAEEREQQPDIHWSKGELAVGSTSYFDIRIVRPPTTGDKSVAPRADTKGRRDRQRRTKRSKGRTKDPGNKGHRKRIGGRPNTRRKIIRAVRRLWNTSPKFRTLGMKLMVPEVRAAILGEDRLYEESSGYRTSSMAKTIGRELTALRNRNKRNKLNKPKVP